MDERLLASLKSSGVWEASKKNKSCYTPNTAAHYLKFYKENSKNFIPDFAGKYKSDRARLCCVERDPYCHFNNTLNNPLGLFLIRAGINPLGGWSYGSFFNNSKLV